jgi:integrase
MTKHNPENERIKRKYFAYLKEAKRHSEPTLDASAKALNRFEENTRYRGFKAFHYEQAIAFKRHLAEQKGQRSGEKLSKATGLEQKHWSTAEPIRKVFREAFACAGLPYFNPHSLRKSLVRLGEEVCKSPEEFKAWSQNLGHEKVLTTFLNYGSVACDRQGEIIRGMTGSKQPVQTDVDALADALAIRLRSTGSDSRSAVGSCS